MNIVITGASRGIGYQTALCLSEAGTHRIFALSRDEKMLIRLTNEKRSGGRIVAIPCDIVNEKSITTAIEKIRKETSGIEVLINNSGKLINKPFSELTSEEWKKVYDVNVFGAVQITKALLTLLKNGKIESKGIRSHVINISSMGGVNGSLKFKGLSAYSSSKGALITLSECLSEELKEDGIRVNCIALGSVQTEMFSEAFPEMHASMSVEEFSKWLAEFSVTGYKFFNGKLIQVSTATP
jgi:3-oxoacyl-[acyl-carrier protein] reductase